MSSRIVTHVEQLVSTLVRFSARVARAFGTFQMFPKMASITIALTLGFWGWQIQEPATDASSFLSNVFRTVQLITLHFPDRLIDAAIPWQLQVARLLVPLVALIATIHLVVGAVTRPARLALMPFTEGHVIVSGSPHLTDSALRTLAERGQRIVMVESSVDVARQSTLEAIGLTVVESDPFQSTTFVRLNLAKASAIFITHDDDLANLELALLAIGAAEKRGATLPPLVIAVRIGRDELARELDLALDHLSRTHRVRYRRLQPDRESLRIEMRRVAPALLKSNRLLPSSLLIIGLTGRWPEILMQVIISSQDTSDMRPILTLVVDETEEDAFNEWRHTRPDLELVCSFCIMRSRPEHLPGAFQVGEAGNLLPDLVIVLCEDENAIATALSLRRPGNPYGIASQPILVRRSKEDRLLERFNGTEIGDRSLNGFRAFGGLVRAETIERVLDHRGEEIAIALHEHYRRSQNTNDSASVIGLPAWDDLSEDKREANRAAAEHAHVLFAAIGRHLTQGTRDADASAEPITDDEVERLAHIEHRRWMADRIDAGWQRGVSRDDVHRIHDCLVPFEELSKEGQDKDRSAVRALIAAVQSAGFEIAVDRAG